MKHALNPAMWVDTYSDDLLRFALLRIRDRDQAKDLVQDAFLTALRNQATYRGEISERNWLYLILKSRIADYFKKKREVLVDATEETDDPNGFFEARGHWKMEHAPQRWDPERMLATDEFMHILERCTDRLSDAQRMVFSMKYLDGAESEEICKEMEISSSNFWVLVHRAKTQLRKCLEINWMNK